METRSRPLKRFVVAAIAALGLGALPISSSASDAAQPSVNAMQECLKAGLTQTKAPISLGLARACAGQNAMLVTARNVNHDGTYIVSTTHGYAIVQAKTEPATSGGDPCYFRTATAIDGGVTDWQGVTMCYDYWAASISGSINQSCSTWFPGAACWYHYSREPYGTYNTAFVEADGYFYQQCLYVIGCNDGIWQDQWYDGPYHAGTWTL